MGLRIRPVADLLNQPFPVPSLVVTCTDVNPKKLHLGAIALLLSHKPNAVALLSSLHGYFWEGIAMNQSLSWVYDEGTVRVVTAAEAAKFFRKRLGEG